MVRTTLAAWTAALCLLAGCAEASGDLDAGADAPPPSTTEPRERATTTEAPPADDDDPPSSADEPEAAGLTGEATSVVRIIDGDTLVVAGDERVRLIGIDTPELAQDECYAQEASAHLAELVPPGDDVRLVHDVERTDRYGRTLAYVVRASDGLDVNLAMAGDGYAVQLTIPPNVARADELGAAVAEARTAGRGLWGAGCDPAGDSEGGAGAGTEGGGGRAPAPAPAAPPPPAVPPPTTAAAGACDPAYPTLCLPPGAPDLDCPDINARRFPVLPPDPHGFDGNDDDGVGCES